MDINMVKEAVLGNMEALVKEDAKKAFVKWLQEKALPAVTEIADKYITRLKEDAESEQGWCKFRDAVFLPIVINGGLWLVSQMLEKVIENG